MARSCTIFHTPSLRQLGTKAKRHRKNKTCTTKKSKQNLGGDPDLQYLRMILRAIQELHAD